MVPDVLLQRRETDPVDVRRGHCIVSSTPVTGAELVLRREISTQELLRLTLTLGKPDLALLLCSPLALYNLWQCVHLTMVYTARVKCAEQRRQWKTSPKDAIGRASTLAVSILTQDFPYIRSTPPKTWEIFSTIFKVHILLCFGEMVLRDWLRNQWLTLS